MLTLLLLLAAAPDCVELQRSKAPRGTHAFVVRVCTRSVEPDAPVPLGALADMGEAAAADVGRANLVESGLVDGDRDVAIGPDWLEHDSLASPHCDSAAVTAVLTNPRALRRASEPRAARCFIETSPRVLSWSADASHVAINTPIAHDIIAVASGETLVAFDRFLGFEGTRARGVIMWPRGCAPLTLDEVRAKAFYPCLTTQPKELDPLTIVVDLAAGTLADVRLPGPPAAPATRSRDPFK